jgi:phosphonate ABC transporter permease subunit PhnE
MSELTARKARRSLLRTILIILLILAIFLIYAIAIQATEISSTKPLDPARQESFVRVLRLLADPDIVTIDADTGNRVLSEAAVTTVERIIETIFMALMASAIGTILAVPISFMAARNLMAPITAPLAAIMAAIIAAPIGGWIGLQITGLLSDLAERATDQLLVGVVVFLGTAGLLWLVLRLGRPLVTEEEPSGGERVIALIRTLITLLLFTFGVAVFAQIGLEIGAWLEENLGPFGFLGNFIFVLSDVLRLFLPAVVALLVGVVAASYGSRYGQDAVLSWPQTPARLLTAVLTFLGTFFVIFAIGWALNWLYQFDNPENWTTIPALIGGGAAGLGSLLLVPNRPFAIGSTIYTVMRSILNVLRAIEPLIMGIVFVVWVSLGPFAGVMALTLHTIAALGKLFSEQVEGIDGGPVEAILATGASRLQMVVYAVIPQVVPPFTAFALYRWDINVRMSTIIGFVGGGGIGFVLSQNIQQLRYRQASVMMLAIAIVVATLDYASSKIRSRII